MSALHTPGGNLQKAAEIIVKNLILSIGTFDAEVKAFGQDLGGAERRLLERYANACRDMVVGTLHFSLQSSRYAVAEGTKDDKTLEIAL